MTSHSNTYRFNGRQIITNEWQLLPLMPLVSAYAKTISNEHSQRAALSDLNHLVSSMGAPSKLLLGEYTREAIQAYVDKRIEVRSPSTLARHIATYRRFDKWLANAIVGFPLPAHEVTAPKIMPKAFEGITSTEADSLIAAAYTIGKSDLIQLRNGIACELIFSTGMRAAEALSVTQEQISRDGRWFKAVRCKGGYYQDKYIPKAMDANLYRWMNARKELFTKWRMRKHYIYPVLIPIIQPTEHSVENFVLDHKSLWRIVNDAAIAAGLHGVHPHTLRHAYAHELLDNSKDIRFVAQALGHRDVKTTMRYTERTHDKIANLIEESMRRNGAQRSELSGETVSRGDSTNQPNATTAVLTSGDREWS